MKLIPNKEKIIVRRKEFEDISAGGIILPEISKENLNEGFVVAVNEHDCMFSVGAYVIFNPYSGSEVEEEGEKYVVISEEDVIVYTYENS